MGNRGCSPEQIIGKLRGAEVLLSKGMSAGLSQLLSDRAIVEGDVKVLFRFPSSSTLSDVSSSVGAGRGKS